MQKIKIALVGAGMFGGDVHLRSYADLQRNGITPWLGRVGMDDFTRKCADVEFELVAVATRSEASALRAQKTYKELTGYEIKPYYGETPWLDILSDYPDLDILAVATPDNLHAKPMLAALEAGVHTVAEKPMTLNMDEADEIIQLSEKKELIVGVDMHKRYDPDHLKIFTELIHEMGNPLYGRAVLEEPLEVSTKTFKWATQSDPFSYVGVHWTDLFIAYLKTKPVSVFAVGQKSKLINEYNIDAYDSVQVSVVFDNQMNIVFFNNWVTPDDFEGPVNQESDLKATKGKVESDSQYRGLRYYIEGKGSRTSNTHFTRDVLRPDGSKAYVGYGKDSLVVCLLAVIRKKYMEAGLDELRGTYPDAHEGRLSVAIIQAAREVRERNFNYLKQNKGAPVTAHLGENGIILLDPYKGSKTLYNKSI
ncbi:gfo/Idh/MocA family oxidoreductase [Candidatus Poribacteria bacterium]|nr:gfo/Idh/MocA family oxidoreductase [Candidatus Poribacteria bacterium]